MDPRQWANDALHEHESASGSPSEPDRSAQRSGGGPAPEAADAADTAYSYTHVDASGSIQTISDDGFGAALSDPSGSTLLSATVHSDSFESHSHSHSRAYNPYESPLEMADRQHEDPVSLLSSGDALDQHGLPLGPSNDDQDQDRDRSEDRSGGHIPVSDVDAHQAYDHDMADGDRLNDQGDEDYADSERPDDEILVADGAEADPDRPAPSGEAYEGDDAMHDSTAAEGSGFDHSDQQEDSSSEQLKSESLVQPASSRKGEASRVDKLEELYAKVQEHPWGTDYWSALVLEANRRPDPEIVRKAYEDILVQFPTSARHWISYVEFEQKLQCFDKVDAIFTRCLRSVVNVDLWKVYLTYIRKIHPVTNVSVEKRTENRATITKAYEFVLQNIGIDKESGSIWSDYLNFIKSGETKSTYEEQQKMAQLRAVYHRVIAIPISNIEAIWKEYDVFENGLNKLMAKKFLSEKSPGYITARVNYKNLKNLTEFIDKQKTWMAVPTRWTERECRMVQSWHKVIQWEKSNPLALEEKSAVVARVMHAYKCALLMLRLYPQVWHEAVMYLAEVGKPDESLAMLKSGLEANPRSLLLSFALAEFEEAAKKPFSEIAPIFDSLVTEYEREIELINAKYDQERERLLGIDQPTAAEEAEWDGEKREQERAKFKQREAAVSQKLDEEKERQLAEAKDALGSIWITYMKVARRVENIRAARVIFGRARKSSCTYQVFVASALMEYHCNKDATVAGKVFELGLKLFGMNEDESSFKYLTAYFDFLIGINDENNFRALCERVLANISPEKSKPIWNRLLEHERNYGDLVNVRKVEKRIAEVFPESDRPLLDSLYDQAQQWSYSGLHHIERVELGYPSIKALVEGGTVQPSASAATVATSGSGTTAPKSSKQSSRKDGGSRTNDSRSGNAPDGHHKHGPSHHGQGGSSGHGSQGHSGRGFQQQNQPPKSAIPPAQQQQPFLQAPHSFEQQGPAFSKPPAAERAADPISWMLSVLPPPAHYNGVILKPDDLIDCLRKIQIPLPNAPPGGGPPPYQSDIGAPGGVGGFSGRPGERGFGNRGYDDGPRGGPGRGRGGAGWQQQQQQQPQAQQPQGGRRGAGIKRKGAQEYGGNEDDDFGRGGHASRPPPDHDIYRARQMPKRYRDEP
ncbi:uncharacterized protein BJ171DRAFT_487077 [Polychytrium aggregatum]|uniref:uncharacterized protein n=1 Tax=Polychytrium aggregatum TaxID=110093 RepID=UPI0022FE9B94|nr:uncharacterized protein BJ171DRAFT_487077 [Polychytrium aggregatum]KAI9209457.1 hypothetical protein BJ171DRAFT_487077 [Polychytrium aggregatum]